MYSCSIKCQCIFFSPKAVFHQYDTIVYPAEISSKIFSFLTGKPDPVNAEPTEPLRQRCYIKYMKKFDGLLCGVETLRIEDVISELIYIFQSLYKQDFTLERKPTSRKTVRSEKVIEVRNFVFIYVNKVIRYSL